MKKVKYLLIILMVSLCLVGCGNKKEEKKEDKTKEEVNEKIIEPEVETNPELEVDKSKNISWIGKYVMDNSNDNEVTLELYLEADNPYLNMDVSYITYSYDNPSEDGFGQIESYYFSFYLDNVEENEIIIDDEFLGIKGSITRTKKGLDFKIDQDLEGTHYYAEGSYSLYNDETEIRGYYVNDKMRVAISPLTDYSRVSATSLIDSDFEAFSTICSNGPIIHYDDYNGYFNIEKTTNGIKIDSDNEYLAGEYVLEK